MLHRRFDGPGFGISIKGVRPAVKNTSPQAFFRALGRMRFMSTVVIEAGHLAGTVSVPPSKSAAHRFLIAAALAGGGQVENPGDSQDLQATRSCLNRLTAREAGLPLLDCGESGSTLRFLIPVALAVRGGGRFTGRGRLMERPLGPYETLFREKGLKWERSGEVLTVEGELPAGTYRLPGDVSSQFVTGLLLALPLAKGNSEILITSPLESEGYVEMTLETLEKFGVGVDWSDRARFLIPGSQRYQPGNVTVPGDWSQGAVWYAANFLGHQVKIEGLDESSSQADRRIARYYWELARPGDRELDVSQCPDLAPALGAMAVFARGRTRLTGAGRLRLKESDRLHAIVQTVNAMGGAAEEGEDSLAIQGVTHLAGGCTVSSCNDHRIAMMAAMLATRCERPVTLTQMECVKKSYPQFWEHFTMLGGNMHVL